MSNIKTIIKFNNLPGLSPSVGSHSVLQSNKNIMGEIQTKARHLSVRNTKHALKKELRKSMNLEDGNQGILFYFVFVLYFLWRSVDYFIHLLTRISESQRKTNFYIIY
jgi:hypothetical protein